MNGLGFVSLPLIVWLYGIDWLKQQLTKHEINFNLNLKTIAFHSIYLAIVWLFCSKINLIELSASRVSALTAKSQAISVIALSNDREVIAISQ